MDMPIVENVTITPKGQIVIPKHICDKLKLSAGEKVYIIPNGDDVIISNKPEHPAIRAMRNLQESMKGKFEEAGLNTEEDIIKLCREVRHEIGREKRGESTV